MSIGCFDFFDGRPEEIVHSKVTFLPHDISIANCQSTTIVSYKWNVKWKNINCFISNKLTVKVITREHLNFGRKRKCSFVKFLDKRQQEESCEYVE